MSNAQRSPVRLATCALALALASLLAGCVGAPKSSAWSIRQAPVDTEATPTPETPQSN